MSVLQWLVSVTAVCVNTWVRNQTIRYNKRRLKHGRGSLEADPYTYILTDLKSPDPKKFWESGERTVQVELLPLIRERAIRRRIGLELGCGVGRLLFPMARNFEEMVGVDIAGGHGAARCFVCGRQRHSQRGPCGNFWS